MEDSRKEIIRNISLVCCACNSKDCDKCEIKDAIIAKKSKLVPFSTKAERTLKEYRLFVELYEPGYYNLIDAYTAGYIKENISFPAALEALRYIDSHISEIKRGTYLILPRVVVR
jgi:hypothetical protein